MKFSLVLLLGLCAVAINAQQFEYTELEAAIPQGPIFDGLKEAIENAKRYAKEVIENITKKLQDLVEKIKNAISPNIREAVKKVIEFVKRIADLANTGIVAKVCINQHSEKIQEIVDRLNAGVAKCQDQAMEELKLIEEEARQTVDEIKGYVQDLYNTINECLSGEENILGKILCITKKLCYIKDQINAAYEAIEATANSVQEKIPRIIEETQQCTANAQSEVMPELSEIMQKVQKCIADNRF